MLRVGLTGGIACGKSVVGEMLARRGAHVTQADRIAHELMRPGTEVYNEIVSHFGTDILEGDGTISRPKLAQAAFGFTQNGVPHPSGTEGANRVAELNAIVHPAVIKRQEDLMDEAGRHDPRVVAVVEAALIYEAGLESHFDKIVVVTCDAGQKAERFSLRTGLALQSATEEVIRRSAVQISDDEKARRADYVIYNNGSLQDTETQVDKVWSELKELARR